MPTSCAGLSRHARKPPRVSGEHKLAGWAAREQGYAPGGVCSACIVLRDHAPFLCVPSFQNWNSIRVDELGCTHGQPDTMLPIRTQTQNEEKFQRLFPYLREKKPKESTYTLVHDRIITWYAFLCYRTCARPSESSVSATAHSCLNEPKVHRNGSE